MYQYHRTFSYWKNKNVKGPKPIPFFGNFKDVAFRKQHIGMLYYDLYKQYPNEKVVGFYRMTSPCLLIRDLEVVKQILIKEFDTFPDRGSSFNKEGLTQNIFHCDADTWKILRTRFSTVFTTCKIKNMFYLLNECSDQFLDHIEKLNGEQPEHDVYKLCLKYAVGSTLRVIFDINVDTFNDDINKLFQEVDKAYVITYERELDMILPGAVKKLNRSILTKESIKFSHEVINTAMSQSTNATDVNNVMDVLRRMRKEGNINTSKPTKNGKEYFLEVTNDLLAAQVWLFYLAGYGNDSLVLTYAMHQLACNPDVQDKLIKEIDHVIENHGGKFTYDTLNDMKYLEMVFHETLRIHPLTNAIQRMARQDIKLEGLDFVIEKGTDVVISPYAIQHDETYYHEPKRFSPKRFLNENVKNRHPCAYLPFGAGRRGCLGSRLAQIQFGICIVKMLSKFRVETSENTIRNIKFNAFRLVLTSEERIYLRLIPR